MTLDFDVAPTPNDPRPAIARVTLLTTRAYRREHDLLVVYPNGAPTQLPNVPLDAAQSPVDGASRLADSLLGPQSYTLKRRIAVVRQSLPPDIRILTRAGLLRTGPNHEATPLRFTLERGARVRVSDWQDDFARVVYEEFTYEANDLSIRTRRAGWVLADALGSYIEHHLFHLRPAQTDGPPVHPQAYWLPLAQVVGLLPLHQRWLERTRALLTH